MRPVLIAGKVVTLARILSRKLEPVSIWIMEVERAAHPVVDRPFDRHPARLEPALPRMEGVVVLDPHREMKVHAPLALELESLLASQYLEKRDEIRLVRTVAADVEENVHITHGCTGRWMTVDV